MIPYIFGIVLFLIELRVLFTTQYYDYMVDNQGFNVYRYANRNFRVKVWHVLLLLIGNVHYLCFFTLLVFILFYLKKMDSGMIPHNEEETYWVYNDQVVISVCRKFRKVLNYEFND